MFDPSVHLSVTDQSPHELFQDRPFPVDCDIHVGHGDSMVCLVLILGNYH